MRLRQFNKAGIEAFEAFLDECRVNPAEPVPMALLESDEHTKLVAPAVDVEPRDFRTKRDAANYLHEKLACFSAEELRRDAGLWTWLSLMYFESVCPAEAGRRRVKSECTYIYVPGSMRESYRHILFTCWNALQLSPQFNRLFLHSKINQLDMYNGVVFNRLFLTRIPCIFEVLDRLYWDEATNKPVKGIVDSRNTLPGNLKRRLPTRIRQLEKTYDLQSLNADQLLELLGEEFQQYTASKKQLKLDV